MLSGVRHCSSVGKAYCQGRAGVGGVGRSFLGSSAGRHCGVSMSSGVPRPVGRPAPPRPPPAPPPPPPAPPRPPPTPALTLKLSPRLLYIARLSGIPYTIGLASSTIFVRSSEPTTREADVWLTVTPCVRPYCTAKSALVVAPIKTPPFWMNACRCS